MNYKIVKYSEIGKIRSGKRLPKGYTVSEKISNNKYIRVRDINSGSIDSSIVQYITDEAAEKLERYKVKTRDVIISVVGTVGAIAQIDESLNGAYLTENCDNLQVDESLCLKDYLKYYLLSEDGSKEIIANTVGSTQPKLPIYGIENFNIKLPSIDNQKRIVKLLNSIDKKIKLNNEINNNLYEEAVALYKDKFKGIGQGKKTIGNYIVPKRGKNLLTRDAINGDTPVVAGGIEPSAYHNQFNTKSPVITISASGANAGYINLWNIPVWASDCLYIDDSITKNVYFWYIVLKTRQNEIFDAQTGSAQPHIYPQHIAEMSIGELNIGAVEKYDNLVAPLFKMIGENQKENKKLSQLRDTLLPKLMNGEIDLANIEI